MEIRGNPDNSMRASRKNFMEDLIMEWGFKTWLKLLHEEKIVMLNVKILNKNPSRSQQGRKKVENTQFEMSVSWGLLLKEERNKEWKNALEKLSG